MNTMSTRLRGAVTLPWGRDQHPDWCAQGHHCGLGEHQAAPIVLDVPGRGRVVLTRIMAADGRQHVEIRTGVTLADGDHAARAHLAMILAELEAHLTRIIRRPRRRTATS
jgi:hypothetical protein